MTTSSTPPPPPAGPRDPANISVQMFRHDMNGIPEFPFLPGYSVRPMRVVDAGLWEDIWRDAEPFIDIKPGLFQEQFGSDPDLIAQRCYIVSDPRGVAAATISAWQKPNIRGLDWGQIHWVATRPSHQGKGLAKAGMSYALKQMAQWHPRALLGTSTGRIGAIRIYLDFGFVPDMEMEWAKEAWTSVKAKIDHPALASIGAS